MPYGKYRFPSTTIMSDTNYLIPFTMVEDQSLPNFLNKMRPIIQRCRIGTGESGTEDIHRYDMDADDGVYYRNGAGMTWLQQCFWLPDDMTTRCESQTLISTVSSEVDGVFACPEKPYSYAASATPIEKYKFVRSGTFTPDLVGFSTPLTYGWGGSGHSGRGWDQGEPMCMHLDIKTIASYIKSKASRPANHDYCRIFVDFLGFTSRHRDNLDVNAKFGFLRDRYSIYGSGQGVVYEEPDQLCGGSSPRNGMIVGVDLGDWDCLSDNTVYGGVLALHLNLTGFNIDYTANSEADSIIWNLLPICDDHMQIPRRACIRFSAISCSSSSSHLPRN